MAPLPTIKSMVSGLLIILSQGSDPLSMNDHYEKVFDAISTVHHNKNDKQASHRAPQRILVVPTSVVGIAIRRRKIAFRPHFQFLHDFAHIYPVYEVQTSSPLLRVSCRVDGFEKIVEKMNGQGTGAETIPFSVAVKAQGNIEDWLCDLLFKMQVQLSELTTIVHTNSCTICRTSYSSGLLID